MGLFLRSRSSDLITGIGVTLILYGFCTVVYSAWDVGLTADERIFTYFGLDYLRGDMSEQTETPPFSRWFGALGAMATGVEWSQEGLRELEKLQLANETIFSYRMSHAVMYLVCSLWILLVLIRNLGVWTGLVFATLISLDPSIKAFSALNVTDANVAWLVGIASTHLYLFLSRDNLGCVSSVGVKGPRYLHFATASFIAGLAVTAKITALLYLPFFALAGGLAIYRRMRFHGASRTIANCPALSWLHSLLIFVVVGASFFIGGVTLGYLGDLKGAVENLLHIILYQSTHNTAGHPTALFGDYRTHGFWYYFLVVFLFKTPLALLVIFSVAIVFLTQALISRTDDEACRRKLRQILDISVCFFLPAVFIFIFLSAGNIHIGIRYLLPAIMLLWIGTAIAVFHFSCLAPRTLKIGILPVVVIGLLADISTLKDGAYLSSFNILAPEPSLNFSDSNSNWHQGLPKHLAEKFEDYESFNGFIGDYLSVEGETSSIIASALNIGGTYGITSQAMLRPFVPKAEVAGHRLYTLTNSDWYRLLYNEVAPPDEDWFAEYLNKLSSPLALSKMESECTEHVETFVLDLKKYVFPSEEFLLKESTFADYVKGNQDLWAAYQLSSGITIEEWGRRYWNQFGFKENRSAQPYRSAYQHFNSVDQILEFRRENKLAKIFFEESKEHVAIHKQKKIVEELVSAFVGHDSTQQQRANGLLNDLKWEEDYAGLRRNLALVSRRLDLMSLRLHGQRVLEGPKEGNAFGIGAMVKLEIPIVTPGPHQLLVEIDYRRAKKLGLSSPKSMVVYANDQPILVGGDQIKFVDGTEIGMMNRSEFDISRDHAVIELYLESHARIRNLLLMWQTCH